MKVFATIERSETGRYFIYIPPEKNTLHVGVHGDGMTVEEAKEDFKNVLYGFVKLGRVEAQEFDFEFHFDVLSVLESYRTLFTLSGLSHLTGINAGQLSHYITGRRKPSAKTMEKIQNALVGLGNNLAQLNIS